jgi:mxaJ protein
MERLLRRALAFAGLASLAAAPLVAQRPGPMTPGILRVCADPDNLPFSNSAQEGMENKLAELIARDWHSKLEYIWWAAPRGLARMLNGTYCDVILQAPAGYDLAGVTRPYYRTGYVIVQRKDAAHPVTSLDDPSLKTMKIGVHLFANDGENTPPAMALSAHGVVGNLIGFSTVYAGGMNHPEDIVKAVADGSIDLAIVWGPIAGYYAKRLGADLELRPLPDDSASGIPFNFSMGIAIRHRDHALKDSLEKFLAARAPEIQNLLQEYGIPVQPLTPDSAAQASPSAPGR